MQSQEHVAAAWQYGVLGIVALVFAYAIIHLFKAMRAEAQAQHEERKRWAAERESLRAEYERRHREVVESYAQSLREDREVSRENEAIVRREFAEMMEGVSAEAAKSSESIATVLDKFYDRFVAPRGGRRG